MNSSLVSGQTVGAGRYILNKQLSDNGATWLAHDEVENKPVVLKFLPPELRQDPRGMEELRSQVTTAREFSHPNIANVYELYEADGEEPFISMEYVEGMTLPALQTMQPGRVFSWTFLAPILKQIFAGLQYVHENRIVQGSLKPSSLMLDRKGQVKLLDVGIAGILNNPLYGGPALSTAAGLLPYLSPEQVDGNPPLLTDDIYSVGVTIYELLTSTPPFHTGDILPQIRGTVPETVEQRLAKLRLNNRVPPIVSSMVGSCLSKDPSTRPQDVETLARSLEFAELAPEAPRTAARPVAAAPAPAASAPAPAAAPASAHVPPPRESKKPTFAIAVVVLLLVVGGGAAWFFLNSGSEDAGQPAAKESAPEKSAVLVHKAREEAEAAKRAAEEAIAKAEAERSSAKPPPTQTSPQAETVDEAKGRRLAQEAAEIARLAARSDTGFVELFNGRDLSGWKGDVNYWSVRDGFITGQTLQDDAGSRFTCLTWDGGQLGDFEMRLQYRFKLLRDYKQAAAAIVYRGRSLKDFEVRGYQYLLTYGGENTGFLTARDRVGMISYTAKTVAELFNQHDRVTKVADLETTPAMVTASVRKEDWNEAVIIAQGDHLIHKINGRVVADLLDKNDRRRVMSGALALELNTGLKPTMVQFKSIRLKKLSK
jgi:hypothetical protein